MRNLKVFLGVLIVAAITLVACEKEETETTNSAGTPTSSKRIKSSTNKSTNSDYPIIITEDLTVEENLTTVILNLNENEVLYSTNFNGIRTNEILLNVAGDQFPDDPENPNNPNLTAGCHVTIPGCLALLVAVHNFNLENCDYSSGIILSSSWNMYVIGTDCNGDNEA